MYFYIQYANVLLNSVMYMFICYLVHMHMWRGKKNAKETLSCVEKSYLRVAYLMLRIGAIQVLRSSVIEMLKLRAFDILSR